MAHSQLRHVQTSMLTHRVGVYLQHITQVIDMDRKIRFNKRTLDALPPCPKDSAASQDEYTDIEMPGLKVLVSKVRQIVFFFRYTFQGRKRTLRLGAYPGISIAEAKQTVMEAKAKLDRGVDPQEESDRVRGMPTFEQHAKEYLEFVEQYKRSANADESKLRIYLVPYFGDRRLCDISFRDIQTYHVSIASKVAKSTANRHLALLSKMFSLAVKWERIEKNPCKGVDKFKEDNQRQRFLTEDEIGRLFKALDQDTNQTAATAIKLLLLSGLRREEVLQARWKDISLAAGTWHIPDGKTGSRDIQINEAALRLLSTIPKTLSPFVFPGKVDPNKPLNNPRKCFMRALKSARIDAFRIHDLRHTHASILVNAGESLYTVQKVLGHRNPKTTQRYSHLSDAAMKSASDKVSAAIGRALGTPAQ